MIRLIGILCTIQIFAIACTQQIAGTSNGSETTNGVTATVRDRDGIVATGALVKAAPASLTPEDESWIVYETQTDSLGQFSIESLRPGRYTVEITSRSGENAALVQDFRVGDTIVQLEDPVLSAAAILSGSVEGAGDGSHVVCIVGLDRRGTTLGSGLFYFGRIASGMYSVIVKEKNTNNSGSIPELELAPNEEAVLNEIDPVSGSFSRSTGFIADPDSLAVVHFLRNQGIPSSDWDGVVTLEEGEIRGITLSGRNMKRLDPSIGECRSIQSLDLSNNRLSTLPTTLSHLPVLYSVNLSRNAFSVLPKVVPRIPVLIRLNAEFNQLSSLPDAFVELRHLESLVLSDNQFEKLPPQIPACKKLRWLKLYRNPITELPDGLYDLTDLRKLGLSYTKIDRLSSRIGNLSELQMLDIAQCGLDSLPSEIGMLSRLTQLWATGNNFTQLPSNFSQLTGLEELQLSSGNLRSLPEDFGALTSLRKLFINSNELSTLPPSITALQSLDELLVGGNRICNPTADIANWLDSFAEADWRSEQKDCD